MKILVVDDEEHIRFFFTEELTEAGYEVVSTDAGDLLFERIKTEKPNLIIMGVYMGADMPPYYGLDLLKKIKGAYPKIKVIICTSFDLNEPEIKSCAADSLVNKTYDLTELKNCIAQVTKENKP